MKSKKQNSFTVYLKSNSESTMLWLQNKTVLPVKILLSILESRLDNVVYRLGFANTRREARQMVSHGHITVDGKKVDIASYLVSPGEVISIREKSRNSVRIKEVLEQNAQTPIAKWLELDRNTLQGKVVALASREDIDYDINETLIVELYSK